MNTLTFVFGQLLTLEMLAAGRRQTVRQRLLDRLNNNGFGRRIWLTQRGKEFVMDNSILVILFYCDLDRKFCHAVKYGKIIGSPQSFSRVVQSHLVA
jgi:hypothetical protein